jgi:orotate phosphoribosyltransferase
MKAEAALKEFEDSRALLKGHFELRSGLHSPHYFQCANVLRYPDRAERLCKALAVKLREAGLVDDVHAVIAPALGGILVGHEVARELGTPCIFAEKQDGVLVMRRFAIESGRRYVVAEDVITRGGRVQETVDIVTGAGGEVAAIGVIVDRSGGKAEFSFPTLSLLQMEPVTWSPDACPLCAEGQPLEHPGS